MGKTQNGSPNSKVVENTKSGGTIYRDPTSGKFLPGTRAALGLTGVKHKKSDVRTAAAAIRQVVQEVGLEPLRKAYEKQPLQVIKAWGEFEPQVSAQLHAIGGTDSTQLAEHIRKLLGEDRAIEQPDVI